MNAKDRQPGLIPQRDALVEATAVTISTEIESASKSELCSFSYFLSRLDAFAPTDEVPEQTRANIKIILGIIIILFGIIIMLLGIIIILLIIHQLAIIIILLCIIIIY